MRRCLLGAVLLAALPGCGDDGGDPPPPDAEPEVAGCATELTAGQPFALYPDGPATQIHASAQFAGGAVWLAFNVPRDDGSGSFDVFLSRVHCDGTTGAPVRVNAVSRGNDVDPMVTAGDDALIVAWQSDNGTGVDNLDILYRTFDADGAPIMAEERILETDYDGAPVSGNAWMPAVTAVPGGGFALAGGRALAETGTFQTFVQRIAPDGSLDGDAIDPIVETGITHSTPAITAEAGGALRVAWTRSEGDVDDVYTARIAPGAGAVDAPPARASADGPTAGPYWAAGADGGPPYLAFSASIAGERQVVVTAGDAAVDLGATGEWDHTPTVAAGPGGGAVFWYRNISGFRNDAVVQRFGYDGASFQPTAERVIPTQPAAAPYGPAITHVQDDVYFIAWSEGTSPDFVLTGQFVDLAD